MTGAAALARRPLLIQGAATPEELAALIVALAAVRAVPAAAARRTSAWARRDRLLRTPHSPGPGAWRAATRPR